MPSTMKLTSRPSRVEPMTNVTAVQPANARAVWPDGRPPERGVPFFRVALTAITSFSYFPLQLATYIGFVAAGLAVIAIPVVIIMRIVGSNAFTGQASTLLAVLFLGGVQLLSLGILGEYVGRIYDEVKGRPLYIVSESPDEIHNLTNQEKE